MTNVSKCGRAAWVGALALLGMLAAPDVRAQILTRGADGFHCQPIADRLCTSDASCGTTGERCRQFGDARLCTPGDALFCCSGAGDCPLAGETEDPTTCNAVSGLSGAGGVCLPDRDYCGATTLEAVARCHTSPLGVLVREWDRGDCDADGLPNKVEVDGGTDPCEAPGPVGRVVDGARCEQLAMACIPGNACTVNDGDPGTCEETGDGAGTFCAPHDEPLYCCGSFVCPDDSDTCVSSDSRSVCVDSTCAGRVPDLLACVTSPGGALVPFSEGDCDGDGVTNGEEIDEAGTDPCGDAPQEDAGAPEEDAGGTGMREDGGALEPGLDVRFEGGGGCACRAQPSGQAGQPWLLALAGVALALLRRR